MILFLFYKRIETALVVHGLVYLNYDCCVFTSGSFRTEYLNSNSVNSHTPPETGGIVNQGIELQSAASQDSP